VYGVTQSNQSTRLSPKGVYAGPYGQIYVEGNRGRSEFDGLYFTGKIRLPKTQVITSYAWSKAYNLADGFGSQPSDVTNLDWERDWAVTPNDIAHRFTLGGTFSLWKGLQFSTIVQANTGKPYNAFGPYSGGRGQVRAIDPATGQQFPRNSFRADGFFSWDMRFAYNIPLGGARVLEAMFEVFNITDHVNFDRDFYVTTYSSPDFGTPTAILNNSQRQAQFGLRFRF
jgi:hypothetical protein